MEDRTPKFVWKDIPPQDNETPPSSEVVDARGPIASTNDPNEGFGRDLVALARRGEAGEIFGRESEIRQLKRILIRKKKNNPLIVGAPGVGKTALVYGIANLIATKATIPELQGLEIREIALAEITSGTAYRGTMEEKLNRLLHAAERSPNLIFFIDEIHTIIRAGAIEGGALDIANILKPALANGTFRCIGATTLDEADRFLAADPAFERRFEKLVIDEPTAQETIDILTKAAPSYETHHQVKILPEAIETAVDLSIRHIHDRHLPDKALDLLDNACTLLRIPDNEPGPSRQDALIVDAKTVADGLANKLDVPVQDLDENIQSILISLEESLNSKVAGQEFALQTISNAMRKSYTGLGSPEKPRHVFGFFGSSGVGKTFAAKALAELLFSSPDAILRLDMSEFKERHSTSRLFGAPPGYVGYTDEGSFASRLRRRPYSIVLLDEFEKAHPEVLDAFLHIFDEGIFSDTKARKIDARQAIFILTSNLLGPYTINSQEDHEEVGRSIRQRLSAYLRPEFINRIETIVPFRDLTPRCLSKIAEQAIQGLQERLSDRKIEIVAGQPVFDWIGQQTWEPGSGARAVYRMVDSGIAEGVAEIIIKRGPGEGFAITVCIVEDQLSLSID